MASSNIYWQVTCIYFVATFLFGSSFATRFLTNLNKDVIIIPPPSADFSGKTSSPAYLEEKPKGSGRPPSPNQGPCVDDPFNCPLNVPANYSEEKPKGSGRPPSPNKGPCYNDPLCHPVDDKSSSKDVVIMSPPGRPNAPVNYSEEKPKGSGRPPSPNQGSCVDDPSSCPLVDFSEEKPKGSGRPPSPNRGPCVDDPFCQPPGKHNVPMDYLEEKPKGSGRPPSPSHEPCYPFCSGEKP